MVYIFYNFPFFAVLDIPAEAATTGESFVYGGRMVPTPENTGVILYSENNFYELFCLSELTCTWFTKTQRAVIPREDLPAMMYIPSDMANC